MLEASSNSLSKAVLSESSELMIVLCEPKRSAIGGGLLARREPLEPEPWDRGGGGAINSKGINVKFSLYVKLRDLFEEGFTKEHF